MTAQRIQLLTKPSRYLVSLEYLYKCRVETDTIVTVIIKIIKDVVIMLQSYRNHFKEISFNSVWIHGLQAFSI